MAKDTKRPRSSSGGNKGGSSLLAGLLVGLAIGITAAVAVVFYVNRSANPFSAKPAPASAPASAMPQTTQTAPEVLRPSGSKDETPVVQNASSASGSPAQKASGIELDFYRVLPGLNEKTGNNPKPAEGTKPTASATVKVVPAKGAWLQAGAFQNEQDADNLKAKLAMLGIESRIQTQDIPGKGLWHRVRIGPLGTPGDVDKARSQLQANGIETVVVKAE